MSALVSSIRAKSWILKITLMCLFLGMLLAMSLKGQQKVMSETGFGGRESLPDMIVALRNAKSESKALREQNEALQKKLADYPPGGGSPELRQAYADLMFWSGRTASEGPGVIVTLKDSAGKVTGMEGIIHDSDIRNVVNELRAAGAEMISVNDQRLVGSTAVRCVGPVTLINDVPESSPYVIKAIGDPNTLEGALKMPRGVFESFTDTDMIKIDQSKDLVLKGYDGSTSTKFAKRVPAEAVNK